MNPALAGVQWAMEPATLKALSAMEPPKGPSADVDVMTIKDGVALIPILGPLVNRVGGFAALFGFHARSYRTIAEELALAVASDEVSSIVLYIDSPGGTAAGVADVAAAIKAAAAEKEVIAYDGGNMMSAAYYMAVCATRIVANPLARLGSLGAVYSAIELPKGRPVKEHVFVSSVSPMKRHDLSKDSHRADLQRQIDEVGDQFVAHVAAERGVEVETVLEKFGKGSTYGAAQALERGMIDEIGTIQDVIGAAVPALPTHAHFTSAAMPAASRMEANMPGSTPPAPIELKIPEGMKLIDAAELKALQEGKVSLEQRITSLEGELDAAVKMAASAKAAQESLMKAQVQAAKEKEAAEKVGFVDGLVKAKLIGPGQKDEYLALIDDIGLESVRKVTSKLQAPAGLGDPPQGNNGDGGPIDLTTKEGLVDQAWAFAREIQAKDGGDVDFSKGMDLLRQRHAKELNKVYGGDQE